MQYLTDNDPGDENDYPVKHPVPLVLYGGKAFRSDLIPGCDYPKLEGVPTK